MIAIQLFLLAFLFGLFLFTVGAVMSAITGKRWL